MAWSTKYELRQQGSNTIIEGHFPYDVEASLSPRQMEVIKSRAFAASIVSIDNIHLLAGHDFDRPLASRETGTLELRESNAGVHLEATIAPQLRDTAYVDALLAQMQAGLVTGISPGFQLARKTGAIVYSKRGQSELREVYAAKLWELSIVTMPVYEQASAHVRSRDLDLL